MNTDYEIAKIAEHCQRIQIETEHPNPMRGSSTTSGDLWQFWHFWQLPDPWQGLKFFGQKL
jgi:hypothetical protein